MAELTKLTGTYIKDGSIPTTALSGGVVSSSIQVINSLPTGSVSSSAQIAELLPIGTISSSVQLPTGIASSSTQVTAYLPADTVSSSTQLPTGIASSSTQIKTYLPTDTVSSSVQVTAFLPSSTVSSSTQLPSGIASSSAQVIAYLPTGTVSSSVQVDFNTISSKPTLVSASSQVDVRNTTGIATIATTGSNTFTGVTSFSDTSNATSYLDGSVRLSGGMSIQKDIRVSGSMVINGLLSVVSMSSQYVTSSQYNVGVSKITLNDDDTVRFAGMSIYDSGSSSPASASIFWDSLQHRFIYENLSGSSYNSAILIAGPKNTNTLGNETGLTSGYLPYATGEDHIDNSVIYQSGTNILIGGTSAVAGGLVQVQSSDNTIVTVRTTTSGNTAPGIRFFHDGNDEFVIRGGDGLRFLGSGVNERVRITGAGNVGIGTNNPARILTVYTSGSDSRIILQNNTTGTAINNGFDITMGVADGGASVWNYQNSWMRFGTNNNERVRIDASGNVGIGTTSPSVILEVSGSSNATSRARFIKGGTGKILQFGADRDTTASPYIGAESNHALDFITNDTQRVRIDTSGNVGINTTSPSTRLHVVGGPSGINPAVPGTLGSAVSASFLVSNQDVNYGILMGALGTGKGWIQAQRVDGTATAYDLVLQANGGNVGIGTTSPTASDWNASSRLVHIYQNDTNGSILKIESSNTVGILSVGNDQFQIGTPTNDPVRLYTSGSERITILGNGNVGIGTTSPTYKLVVSNGGANGLEIDPTNASGVQTAVLSYNRSTSAYTPLVIQASNVSIGSPSNPMFISGSGNVGIGNTNPSALLEINIPSVTTGATSMLRLSRNKASGYGSTDFKQYYNSSADYGLQIGNTSSDLITLNNYNGYFGIGTTGPVEKLEVNGTNVSTAIYDNGMTVGGNRTRVKLGYSNNYNAGLSGYVASGQPGVDRVSLGFHVTTYTTSVQTFYEAMTLTDAGSLGIGLTNPSYKLHVTGSAAVSEALLLQRAGSSLYLNVLRYWNGTGNAVNGGAKGDILVLGNQGGDPLVLATNNAERVRIDSSGNVGIGTTSPTNGKLEIAGSADSYMIYADPTSFGGRAVLLPGRFFVGTFANGYPEIGYNFNAFSSTYTKLVNDTAWKITFGSNNRMDFGFAASGTGTITWTNHLSILSTGNVGIGTTNPSTKLHVAGDIISSTSVGSTGDSGIQLGNGHRLGFDQSGTRSWTVKATGGNLQFFSGDSSGYHVFSAAGVGIGTTNPGSYKLYVSGDQYISGTLTEASSIVLKENLNPITDALTIISQLKGYTYDRKDGSATQQPGLIAEEVEHILPNIVSRDTDGNASGVQYTKIIAYLVESIKELKQELDSLRK